MIYPIGQVMTHHAERMCFQLTPKRSYQTIATILTARHGVPVSSGEVKRMCGAAERKVSDACLADPVICQLLQEATQPTQGESS